MTATITYTDDRTLPHAALEEARRRTGEATGSLSAVGEAA